MTDQNKIPKKKISKYIKENKIDIIKKEIKNLNYEESIHALELILSNVQDDNISLDQIQTNYLKGNILLKHCEELLQHVEQEINEIDPENLNFD